MIGWRWQIWIPRALAVVVFVLAAQYLLGLAVRSAAVTSSATALGTPIEIDGSRVSLTEAKLVLSDLRWKDPRSPSQSLLEADRCELKIATQPLLQKQIVATGGRVSGLRLNAFSGASDAQHAPALRTPTIRWIGTDAEALTGQWLSQLAARFQQNRADQLQSVERTEAFCLNWSRTSAELEARGEELNDRVAALQTALHAAEANPLRGAKVLADLPQTIAELHRDFAALNADLAKLPDELDAERRSIVAARRADEAAIRQRTTVPHAIEANTLSAYFLRQQASRPLEELLDWLRWLREPVLAPRGKTRGQDLLFAGCRPAPNLLIQALELRGAARIAGQPVDLRGLLSGLSSAPRLASEPIRLRLTGTGSMPLELQVTIDRTRGVQRDAVLLDCQGILWQPLALGRPDQLAVTIGPSLGSLSLSVAVEGDSLTGEIQMTQQNVRITPALAGEYSHVPLAAALSDTLGRVDSLATRASLGGTLHQPTCTLWSNLGPAVAEAIDRALEKASSHHARATIAAAGQQVDEQLTTVEQQMNEVQARWSARFGEVQGQLDALATSVVGRGQQSPDRLGRRSPTNSVVR